MMSDRHQVVIALFIAFLRDGQVLLSRRLNTGFMDGSYDLPAGHLEHSETLKDAAAREVKEEIGIDLKLENLRLFHVSQTKYFDDPYINFMFMADKWEGEPRICEPDQSDDLQFFSLDNLPKEITPHVKEALEHINDPEISYSYIDQSAQQ
jgi:8-oxo-dGTP diphosphatase